MGLPCVQEAFDKSLCQDILVGRGVHRALTLSTSHPGLGMALEGVEQAFDGTHVAVTVLTADDRSPSN